VVAEGNMNTTQGTALQICVTPTAETMEQGAFIREIEEFYFSRDVNVHHAILAGDADSSKLTDADSSKLTVLAFIGQAKILNTVIDYRL
jgi:hypothetical protein